MVTARYLLRRPKAPGAARLFVDQQVMPTAIDLAAMAEAGAERLAVCTKAQPAATLAAAFGLSFLLATLAGRKKQTLIRGIGSIRPALRNRRRTVLRA